MSVDKIILGGGITGVAAGMASGLPIFEAENKLGGICSSYYMKPYSEKRLKESDGYGNAYRFELGGGHWIFGTNNKILNVINSFSEVKTYKRNSAVYFTKEDLYVPYPLQNHLSYLPKDVIDKALREIGKNNGNTRVANLKDWLELYFGKTLCEIFFFPFHQFYTAGIYPEIAPCDKFKTPMDKNLIIKGAKEKTPQVGYNAEFVYPQKGLDDLIKKMAVRCRVNYTKRIEKIDINKKEIFFDDGSGVKYEVVISTLPLNKVIQMAEIELYESSVPYTSVLVMNIGAKRGAKAPDYHWLYIPDSKSGFHRVGFYSNVDNSFLPISSRKNNDRVSIYVEKAYKGGDKPEKWRIKTLYNDILKELKNWRFIREVEIVDCTWIDVAYTWELPGSNWRSKALRVLKDHNIFQVGRYGRWSFQGIADSIRDGIFIGGAINKIK